MSHLDMDAATLAKLSRLLDEALELEPAARARWIESLGAPFDALKPRLRDLLSHAASIETGEFLSTIPKIGPGAAVAPARTGTAGTLVGPYRLLREIGSGGMGSVWLAERADGLIQRNIALKLPHLVAPRRAELAARMARERDILAALDHRNIARLYDAGVTSDGQPFLALEYVEGVPIDQYCAGATDRKPLPIAARLRLFLQVAHAVAYAHGKLVVHRDLKPANILVAPNGGVRLLDFGIAKLLDEGEAKATQLTQAAGGAFTPDYASPEQILGEPLTVASDVYSLGVVLYELLAGSRPYRLKRDSRGALEDAIVQAEPARPSDAAPPVLRTELRGDLDTITLKALKKNPAERYATVNALAEDITRYLEHRPVLARPDSGWYRLRKFVRRNRVAVTAATAAAASLVMVTGFAVGQMVEARAQRDQAERMRQRALATSDFLDSVLNDVGRDGKPMTLAESLDHSTAILERNYTKNEAANAMMLYEASRRYAQLGKSDRELQLLDRVAASARTLGDFDLLALSQCSAASVLLRTDRPAAELRLADVDRELARGKSLTFASGWYCGRARADLLEAGGDTAGAIRILADELALDDRQPEAQRMPVQARVGLLDDLAHLKYKNDDVAGSLAALDEAIRRSDAAGRDQSMSMVITIMNYAATLTRAGEVSAAVEQQRRALTLVAQIDPSGEPPVGFSNHLATSQLRLEHSAEAAELAHREAERASEAGNARVAAIANFLEARALGKLGKLPDAERLLIGAEETFRANPGANQRYLNDIALARAELMRLRGDPAGARSLVDALLARLGYPSKQTAQGLGGVLTACAQVALAQGDAAAAEHWTTDALALEEKTSRSWDRSASYGQAALAHAQALAALERRSEAVTYAMRAERALTSGFSADHPDTQRAHALLSQLNSKSG